MVYGPPETVDLLTLYDAAPAAAAHDNDTRESPVKTERLTGAKGSGSIGFAETSPELGPSSPSELIADTT